MENLWIKENYINRTENYSFGEAQWFKTFTNDLSTLYKSLQREYGKAQNMYVDTKEGAKKVGWIFTKRVKYEDTNQTYLREVWVEVAVKEPVTETKITIEHAKFA